MDKLAVISDIHGNIPALEAVFESIEERNVKKIICIGDLVGKGPESDLAIDLVKEKCHKVLLGNWDYLMQTPKYETTFKWHRDQLGEERLEYLKSLPIYYQFLMSGKLIRLSHAHPMDVYNRVLASAPIKEKLTMFAMVEGEATPQIAGYGDIHMPYIQYIDEKIIFNTGSVGNPLDVNTASYVIIEGYLDSKTEKDFSIDFVRVPYDIELALRKAKHLKMPELEEYTEELRSCKYRGRKKVF